MDATAPNGSTPEGSGLDESALVSGFAYPTRTVFVPREKQTRKHTLCGIDPALFGDEADISFFAFEGIMATRHAGISINGSVHMTQAYDLRRPIRVDEKLQMRGSVTGTEDVPKGRIVRSRFDLIDADGKTPLVLERSSIRLNAEASKAAGAKKTPSTVEAAPEGEEDLAVKQLVPEKVASFSDEADNLIHSDPDVAKEFGFRAPIAGGLMASHFMLEALRREGPIETLDFEMRFLRPMFWDARLTLRGVREAGILRSLRVVGDDGKPTSRAVVRSVSNG